MNDWQKRAEALLLIDHYYPLPWTLVEPADDNGAAYIRDRNGGSVAMLMWPAHGPDDEQRASEATYEAGRMMAAVAAWGSALTAERDALKAAKWDVKHVDAMNDMVLIGLARDDAEQRVQELTAERDRLIVERDAAVRAGIERAAGICEQPCKYCTGILTGLPGNACENCMNTGLDHSTSDQCATAIRAASIGAGDDGWRLLPGGGDALNELQQAAGALVIAADGMFRAERLRVLAALKAFVDPAPAATDPEGE